nr:MAG TPA: hypothetical protein [Herelleviridae sp.]
MQSPLPLLLLRIVISSHHQSALPPQFLFRRTV